jgi:nucleoside-diphosphate-sugar epimerase
MSFYDIAQLIKKERPQFAGKIEELNKTDEKFYIRISNEKARTTLGWQPRTRETSILASVDSLMK